MSAPAATCSSTYPVATVDCSRQPEDWLAIPSIPDITGLGVLIALLVPACIMVIILTVYYLFAFDPTLDPLGRPDGRNGQGEAKLERPNPFDSLILGAVRKIAVNAFSRALPKRYSRRLRDSLAKCVLNLTDLQMLFGIGYMISAITNLPKGLPALHWKMVVYVAWLSLTTSLCALTFLGHDLVNHSRRRFLRIGLVLVLLVMVIVGLVFASEFTWDLSTDGANLPESTAPSSYAICHIRSFKVGSSSSAARNSLVLCIVVLVIDFASRFVRLFRQTWHFGLESLSAKLVRAICSLAKRIQGRIGTKTMSERIVSNIVVSAHIVVCIWIDMFSSLVANIFWLALMLVWGLLNILQLRRWLERSCVEQDTSWSFGQVLPLVLVAGPLLFVLDALMTKYPEPTCPETDTHELLKWVHELSDKAWEYIMKHFNNGKPVGCDWILDPDQYEKYYDVDGEMWMLFAPILSLVHAIIAAYSMLESQWLGADLAWTVGVMIVWFIFTQGSLLHLYILLASCVCHKRGKACQAAWALTFVAVLGLLSVFLLYPNWFGFIDGMALFRFSTRNRYVLQFAATMLVSAISLAAVVALFLSRPRGGRRDEAVELGRTS